MKIVAINGSPKGRSSNTNVMVKAFLKGAQKSGAKTVNIFLSEKDIKHCKGCHSCWFNTPGQCVNKDDMTEVLSLVSGANIIILATPVYFENISGMLKTFMDRLTMTGNPYSQQDLNVQAPKLVMISNCGFPDRSEFQVISHWINRVTLKMRTELIAEIYTPQGKLLSNPTEEFKPTILDYINYLEQAGKEIAAGMKLSEETQKLLQQNFIK